jgi:hypothetical protein
MSEHVPADPQSLTRIGTVKADRLWPRDSAILTNDRVVVARKTDVRVRVDGTIGHGTVYLTPELGRCPGSDIGRHIAGRNAPSSSGSYEFRKDTVGRGSNAPERFILVVKNGAAVVQWRAGQLQVRALDEQISNVGSAFTVLVDSAARRGIVTVQQGLVTLRSGTVAAGQSFTFGPGQPLQPVVVRDAGLDEIHFHSNDVWKNPFTVSSIPHPPIPHPALTTVRALPWKKITIGAVGIGAASYAAVKFWPRKGPPPPPPVKAFVVVTLPL